MKHSKAYLQQLRDALDALDLRQVEDMCEQFAAARERDAQIFLCGNGGSGATASHLANDLGKGASLDQARRFRVIALTDNVPWMTALANDISYDVIFAEQLRNLARPGDVLLAISGSGNSANIIQAVEAAKELGVETIGWTGFGKDASTGLGRFELGEINEIDLLRMGSNMPNSCYTLAPCVPEKDSFRKMFFTPFTRFGRHGDVLAKSGSPFKNPVIMADEGGIFVPGDSEILKKPYIGSAATNISKAEPGTVAQGYSLFIPVKVEA